MELKRLDSEIRSEDKCWWRDGWGDRGGGVVLLLPFLFGDAANWKCVSDGGLVFSEQCVLLVSKLKALPLCTLSFALFSKMLASPRLCLVCLSLCGSSPSLAQPPLCEIPGKMMASRLAWLSFSLACHSAVPLSCGGEKGQGSPTEAARVEVL